MPHLGILKHIEEINKQSLIKGFLSWNQTQKAYHPGHSFCTSIKLLTVNLLTGHSRYRRAISVVTDVPNMSLTLLTNPFLSLFIAIIFAIGQLICSAAASLSRAISPTLHFLLMGFHLASVARTSFLYLLQNSLEMCCTLLQRLQQ